MPSTCQSIVFFKRFYLLIFRERGREIERGEEHRCERETSNIVSHTCPDLDQTRHPGVPCLGVDPAIFHFVEQCPTN